MSRIEEVMRERLVIKGAQSYVAPGQVTNLEIETGAVIAGDIADNAITADKIAAACLGNGLKGGAGSAMEIDADESTLTSDVAGKVGVMPLGVTAAKLAADVHGAGIAGAAGAAFSFDPDAATVELSANKSQVMDDGVNYAALMAAAKEHTVTVELPAFLANGTVRAGVLAVPTGKSYRVTKVELAAYLPPIDADGTCLVSLVNYDSGATAEDTLVAAWDAENLVAKVGSQMTLVVAPADIELLGQNDFLFVVMVNSSIAIDTPWTQATITVTYREET